MNFCLLIHDKKHFAISAEQVLRMKLQRYDTQELIEKNKREEEWIRIDRKV